MVEAARGRTRAMEEGRVLVMVVMVVMVRVRRWTCGR